MMTKTDIRTKPSKARMTIAQLAKVPILGTVKTRMRAALTEQQCLDLHKNMTTYVLSRLYEMDGVDYQLWGSRAHSFFDDLCAHYDSSFYLQSTGDLGQRLCKISAFAFQIQRQKSLVLIGSDCPALDPDKITSMHSLLVDHDVSLLPAEDGGYVAIACAGHYPCLFENIDWGTERVLEHTVQQARANGLSVVLGEVERDIDRPEDLALLTPHGIYW